MSVRAAMLPGGRLHLQHGPIDLVIGAEGARSQAYRVAHAAFDGLLEALVGELGLLRQGDAEQYGGVRGAVARRMVRAVRPHADFVTPMAAVAGAVADHVLARMVSGAELSRAYVNNGGDIALHLAPGAAFRLALSGLDARRLGLIDIGAEDRIGGVATSGQGGRSLSRGIADCVTVLARDAASADAAATLIANAVDLPGHPEIARAPARRLRPDSDLGARRVVTRVGPLSAAEVAQALRRGAAAAEAMRRRGLCRSAALVLRGQLRVVGSAGLAGIAGEVAHA